MTSKTDFIKGIKYNKDLETNIPKFSSHLVNAYYEFAYLRFALNYFTFYEVAGEGSADEIKEIGGILKQLNQIISVHLIGTTYEEHTRGESLLTLGKTRNVIIEKMKVFTNTIDKLQVYEHILNRLEYKYKDLPLEEDTNAFAAKIFEYIFADGDNLVINNKIKTIVGQLPVRMTKNRFYDILNDSLSLYQEGNKEDLDGFLYTIRTVAMLDDQGQEMNSLSINNLLMECSQTDFKVITQEKQEELVSRIADGAQELQSIVDIYIQMQELVNNLYVLLLNAPYRIVSKGDTQLCQEIVMKVYEGFLAGMSDDLEHTLDCLYLLEGKQEQIYEDICMMEPLLFDIKMQHQELLSPIGQDKVFEVLYLSEKLLSSSIFVELIEKEEDLALIDGTYLRQMKEQLMDDFAALFKRHNKEVNRSIMAMVLGSLPAFFNSQQEIKEYIEYSLNNCNNKGELCASVALLKEIMNS